MQLKNHILFQGILVLLAAWGTCGWALTSKALPLNSTTIQDTREEDPVERHIIITREQAEFIGHIIWLNETGGKRKNLIMWNDGENFLSLGIGHFIWFPENVYSPFEESFPKLIAFFEQQAVVLPDWLTRTSDCPWATKDDFLKQNQSRTMDELQALLTRTVPQQVQFMIRRLESALPAMIASLTDLSSRAHVREQFHRVAETPEGVYVLVDYVNFKGDGTSLRERYSGQGWGLLQVLLLMRKDAPHAREEFADAAETILIQRVQNAPERRREKRWLSGWKNRINSYRLIQKD